VRRPQPEVGRGHGAYRHAPRGASGRERVRQGRVDR
jgi:hypothetical protein